MNEEKNARLRLVINNELLKVRSPSHVHFRATLQGATGYALDFLGAVKRNNGGPLRNSGYGNIQSAGYIRSGLEMVKDVLLKHGPSFTTVETEVQPQLIDRMLTSVDMSATTTLAERIQGALDALGEGHHASWLAGQCSVSPAAVAKWLSGETKNLKADVLQKAAKALRVNHEWLRTGNGSRQQGKIAQDEAKVDDALKLLSELHGPLSALIGAIERLGVQETAKKTKRT